MIFDCCLGPVYQTLEADEEEQPEPHGNDEYELANVDGVHEIDTRGEDVIQPGANVYQPLTLERDASAVYKQDDSGEKGEFIHYLVYLVL